MVDHISEIASSTDKTIPLETKFMSLILWYDREYGAGSVTKVFEQIVEYNFSNKANSKWLDEILNTNWIIDVD